MTQPSPAPAQHSVTRTNMSWIGAIPPGGTSDDTGSATGFGEYDDGNGNVYKGGFKDGDRHGQGERRYADGSVYKGAFKDDCFHEQGTMTWGKDDGDYGTKAGDSYTGAWYEQEMHGQGTMTRADGTVESGRWEEGTLVAPNTAERGILGQVTAIKMALSIDTPAAQMRNVVIEANGLLGLPGSGTIPQQIAELFSQLGL